jgi:glucosamine-6-phosphate deaminase
MEVIIQPTPASAARLAANVICRLIHRKPDAVIGLSTGNTPLGLYQELVARFRRGEVSFGQVRMFNLDEYVGLAPDHAGSYRRFMADHLFNHIDVAQENIHIPDGLAPDIPAECDAYERAIGAAGGIDLQLLGIGTDGHIGFNEPSSSLRSRTRLKTLTERTRRDNAAPFGGADLVPRHVLTMGLGTISDARACLVLAFGLAKAAAAAKMIEGSVTASVPASVLQLHPHVQVLLDEEAASKLERSEYYRAVYEGKPSWQSL